MQKEFHDKENGKLSKVILNDNKETVETVKEALKANDGYCPCRAVKTPDTNCMCKEFREQKSGLCHCELYRKVEDN